MEHPQRLIFLALAVGWTLFRLLRYVRVANTKRAGPAVTVPAGVVAPRPADPPAVPATVQSPIEPAGGTGSGLAGFLAAAGILVAGNAVIWPVLFLVPAFEAVPAVWRLTAGMLANLFLIRAASKAAARAGSGSQQNADDDRNPIR
ncbi:MAG TPA: hypothetical protein VEH00_01730 [Steroidobacteraceae bacterium]|nr:hypothetical protein [Steroidobacteraceae bacterium]